jgi:hypothetical protein
MDYFDKTMARILPLHPDSVHARMDKETIRIESEKWCKPFACRVQSCLSPKIRSEDQKKSCLLAPAHFKKCIDIVSQHMEELIKNKLSKT